MGTLKTGDRLEFDSYIVPRGELEEGIFRLLEVDNRTVIPTHTQVRVLVSSADVLHSWTVPSLGVKADAVPGRLNQLKFIIQRPGLYFGQCSEICGANHRLEGACLVLTMVLHRELEIAGGTISILSCVLFAFSNYQSAVLVMLIGRLKFPEKL